MVFDKANYKLIAIDLDDTMIYQGALSPGVMKALSELSNRGVEIVVATGRSLSSLPKSVRKLPFIRYAVMSNGACVYDFQKNKVIIENTIERCMTIEIIKATRMLGTMSICYRDVFMVTPGSYLKFMFFFSKAGKEIFGNKKIREIRKEFDDTTKIVLSLPSGVRRYSHNVEKILYRFSSEKKLTKALDIIKQFPVEAISLTGLDLEVNARGITKAHGLQILCSLLSISPERTIAVGDGTNDLEMLEFVGYSIAMGNASEKIKSIADAVAPNVKEDGLATIIKEMYEF